MKNKKSTHCFTVGNNTPTYQFIGKLHSENRIIS